MLLERRLLCLAQLLAPSAIVPPPCRPLAAAAAVCLCCCSCRRAVSGLQSLLRAVFLNVARREFHLNSMVDYNHRTGNFTLILW